jgi:hypothetical protein
MGTCSSEEGAQIFALLSDQGTAASETALCDRHVGDPMWREIAFRYAADCGDIRLPQDFTDCTGNEALSCLADYD